jgi:hypothetical protein
VSFKLPKAEVSKPLLVVDREGGHELVDHELWEKALRVKESIEELKLSMSEAPKPEVSK